MFACSDCDRSYAHARHLGRHRSIEHGATPVNPRCRGTERQVKGWWEYPIADVDELGALLRSDLVSARGGL